MDFPVKPQLCGWRDAPHGEEPLVGQPGFAYELKLDGNRLIARKHEGAVTLWSRAGNETTAEYPELVAALLAVPADFVLDGEVVVMRDGFPSFLDLQNRMALSPERRAADLRYRVYDLLVLDGLDLTGYSYELRRVQMEGLALLLASPVELVESFPAERAGELWAFVLANRLEGVIAKPVASAYRVDYRGDWYKVKRLETETFAVLGYTPGAGNRIDWFGALVIGQAVGGVMQPVGCVGTGFTFERMASLMELFAGRLVDDLGYDAKAVRKLTRNQPVQWVAPGLECRVEFAEKLMGVVPRFPSFKGLTS